MCFIYGIIYSYIKENMMCQNSNEMFNNGIKNSIRKYILKQWGVKLWDFKSLCTATWWGLRSTKSQKVLVLHYSKYIYIYKINK